VIRAEEREEAAPDEVAEQASEADEQKAQAED
jgi:hypothetical protein